MPSGLDGYGGGRGGFDNLNAAIKSRTRLDPQVPDDPIRPEQPRRRLAKALVAVVAVALIIVVLLLAL